MCIGLAYTGICLAQEGLPPASVKTVDAVTTAIAPVIWVPGEVIGKFDARIGAEVAGRIINLLEVGESVAKGGVIGRIDDLTIRLKLAESEADINRAKAREGYLEREVGRVRDLIKKNLAAKNRLDELEADLKVIRSEVKLARARLAQTSEQLERSVIKAPFAGIVAERSKQPGERVDVGDEVVRLFNPDELEILASVPQRAVGYTDAGNDVAVKDDQLQLIGKVRAIVPVGDTRSRLYETRIEVSEPSWRAGHVVRVAFPVGASRDVVGVPRDALVIRSNGISVYRIKDDDIAENVPIQTGIANEDIIEVIGSIVVGDQVIVQGNERLRQGQKVNIQ